MRTGFNSILIKLGILVFVGVSATILALATYSGQTTRRIAMRVARQQTATLAAGYADQIKTDFNNILDISRTLAYTFSQIADPDAPLPLTRPEADGILKRILIRTPGLFGIWTCWEPNAFDNRDGDYVNQPGHDHTGRYLPYFTRDEKGEIHLGSCTDYSEDSEKSGWYMIPRKTRRELLTAPTIYPVQNREVMMVSASVPIIHNTRFYGVIGGDISVEWLQDFAEKCAAVYHHKDVTVAILAHDGTVAAFSGKPDYQGKSLRSVFPEKHREIMATIEDADRKVELADGFLTARVPIPAGRTGTSWQLRIRVPEYLITAEADALMWRQVRIGLFILAASVIIMICAVWRMVCPLVELVRATRKITAGNLAQQISVFRSDEIGILAECLREMILKFKEVINQIQSGTAHIVSAGSQLSDASRQVSEGASQQAAALEEISAAVEEMTANISQTTDNARQTERISRQASGDIIESRKSVDETVRAMKEIADEISTINEISRRTDMLAINAAIEASRADQHGKGFATVAGQVKTLSEKTQQAAGRIEKITRSSMQIAERSGELLRSTVPDVQKTHHLIQEISAACVEQNTGISQINDSISQMNIVVQQNAAAAEEMAASAVTLTEQARRLNRVIAFFSTEAEAPKRELSGEAQQMIADFISKIAEMEAEKLKTALPEWPEPETGITPEISGPVNENTLDMDESEKNFEKY